MELPQWVKDFWPAAAGVVGGGAVGGWLGSTIGSVFGEGTWFHSVMSFLGGIGGAIGGYLLANNLAGRDSMNPTRPSLSSVFTEASGANGARVLKAREGGDISEREAADIMRLIPEADRGKVRINHQNETITLDAGYSLPTPALAEAIRAATPAQAR